MKFTNQEFIASVRENYQEMQELFKQVHGEIVTYPDYEAALDFVEKNGLNGLVHPSADWEVLEKLEADTLRFMVVDLQNGVERMEVAHRTERTEWLSLEKQYSESLGRLAQLCDEVCPWILTNGKLVPIRVAAAADEIMEYVEAVRP